MSAPTAVPSTDVAGRVELLRAVADPTRLRVLDVLGADGPRCHCELEATLGVRANRLSFHLRVLREAGLVATRRRGRQVEYHLEPDGIAAACDALPATPPAVRS